MSCTGKQCGYNIVQTVTKDGQITRDAGCSAGSGSCFEATVLNAEPTNFHDATLIAATEEIQKILKGIQPDPAGRKLSFINTNMGLLLAWVEHGKPVPPDAVTDKNTDEEVAEALKLTGFRSTKAQSETAA
jgi:hypothetical protein